MPRARGKRLGIRPARRRGSPVWRWPTDAVFAADSGNRVVLRYDRSGKLLGRIGEKNKDRDIPGFVIPSPYLDVEIAPGRRAACQQPGSPPG